jgi:hypothetical protein
MKKLESVGRSLSKQEQKMIKGGTEDEPGLAKYGACIGSVGCWTYYDPGVSFATCRADIQSYCSSGSGICGNSPVCG